MASLEAHVKAIEDDVECAFLDKYADWPKYLRKPLQSEIWLDGRIRRAIKPHLEPHIPVELPPDDLNADAGISESDCTEGERLLWKALDNVREFHRKLVDPWFWLEPDEDASPKTPFELVSDDDPTAPDMAFEKLVERARRHQMRGEQYNAVAFYSCALYVGSPSAHPGLLLEAQDATQALGIWNSQILTGDIEDLLGELHRAGHWPGLPPKDSSLRSSVLLARMLRAIRFPTRQWAESDWQEERARCLKTFKQHLSRFQGTSLASSEGYYLALATVCCCQGFLMSTMSSPFGQIQPPAEHPRHLATRALLFVLDMVESCNTVHSVDVAGLDFLRYRTITVLRAIQPYLECTFLRREDSDTMKETFDAISALALSPAAVAITPRLSEKLKPVVLALHGQNDILVLGHELASDLAVYLGELVQRKDPAKIEAVVKAFQFLDVGRRARITRLLLTLTFKVSRLSSLPLPGLEAVSCHSRLIYNITAYHEAHSQATEPVRVSCTPENDAASSSPLQRFSLNFCVPLPSDQEGMLIRRYQLQFYEVLKFVHPRNAVGTAIDFPAYLQRIFVPHIQALAWPYYAIRMEYVRKNVDETAHPEDEENAWQMIARAIGLGRVRLSRDDTTRTAELKQEIAHLEDSLLEFQRLARANNDDGIVQGQVLAQLQMTIGEAYFELSKLPDMRDTALFRSAQALEDCKRKAVQFHHPFLQVVPLTRLIDIQADLWRRHVGGVRAEDVHLICLEAETLLRPRQLSIEQSATDSFTHVLSWRKAVVRGLQTIWTVQPRVENVYAVACEVSLAQGKALEAFCWTQRGKANVTAGLITQQDSLARFASWLGAERGSTRDPDIDLVARWRQFVKSESGDPSFSFAQGRLSLEKVQDDFKWELDSLRKSLGSKSSMNPMTARGSHGRTLWIDWSEASGTDAYLLCVTTLPGLPQFTKVAKRPSEVHAWKSQNWAMPGAILEDHESTSALRDLDSLISPLTNYLEPDDILVLCLTGELHSLPIHALHLRDNQPLICFHPVVYAPNFAVYSHCIHRSQHPGEFASSSIPAIASVYPSLSEDGPTAAHRKFQEGMHRALRRISDDLAADFYWDADVTRECLLRELQHRALLFFIGHCISDEPKFRGLRHHLVLGRNEVFSTSDFLDRDMPPSYLVLLESGTSQHIIRDGDEMMSLIIGALTSGASSVLGTLWPVGVVPAVNLARLLGNSLKDDQSIIGGGIIDVARATQRAILELRDRFHKPIDWAAYVLYGSPIMRDIWHRAGEGMVSSTEGSPRC